MSAWILKLKRFDPIETQNAMLLKTKATMRLHFKINRLTTKTRGKDVSNKNINKKINNAYASHLLQLRVDVTQELQVTCVVTHRWAKVMGAYDGKQLLQGHVTWQELPVISARFESVRWRRVGDVCACPNIVRARIHGKAASTRSTAEGANAKRDVTVVIGVIDFWVGSARGWRSRSSPEDATTRHDDVTKNQRLFILTCWRLPQATCSFQLEITNWNYDSLSRKISREGVGVLGARRWVNKLNIISFVWSREQCVSRVTLTRWSVHKLNDSQTNSLVSNDYDRLSLR